MKVHVYRSADGWRWRIKARNGRIVADSGEAYSTQANAKRAVQRLWVEFQFMQEPFRA